MRDIETATQLLRLDLAELVYCKVIDDLPFVLDRGMAELRDWHDV